MRLLDLVEWELRSSKSSSGLSGIQRYGAGCITTGIAWSSYVLIFYSELNSVELFFKVLIISTLAGGSASFLAANRFISISYSMILLVPISVIGLFSVQHQR